MTKRDSKRALITYAAVHDELMRSNDFLRGIIPIFAPIAVDHAGEEYREAVFQKDISEIFGLRLPEEILSFLPTRLESLGLLERKSIQSGAIFFWKPQEYDGLADYKKISQDIEDIFVKFSSYIDEPEFLNLASITIDKTRLDDILFDFLLDDFDELEGAHLAIYGEAEEREVASFRSEEQFVVSRFIDSLKEHEPKLFDAIGAIRNALVVSELIIELGTRRKTNKNDVDVSIYIDSPLMMDYLGTSGNERKSYAEQIINGLREVGARISIFDHSVDEISDNLRAVLSKPKINRTGPTAVAIMKGEVEEDFVTNVMHDPEYAVEQSGIEIMKNPKSTIPHNQKSYMTAQDDQQLYADMAGIHRNQKARDRDVESISLVLSRRGHHSTNNIFRSKHLLVTNNDQVSAASKQFSIREKNYSRDRVPPAISTGKLAAAIWLEVGLQDKLDIDRTQLIISCARASATNPKLIERILFNLKRINPENASQFEAMMTQPRYLRMANDNFFGNERRVTADQSIELFEKIREDLIAEERTRAATDLGEATSRYRAKIQAKDQEIERAEQEKEGAKLKVKESFNHIAGQRIRRAKKITNSASALAFIVIFFLTLGASYGFGAKTLYGVLFGLTAMFLVAAAGYLGLNYFQFRSLIAAICEKNLRLHLRSLGYEDETKSHNFDILNERIYEKKTKNIHKDGKLL